RLRRMFGRTITRIHHRHAAGARKFFDGPGNRVSHGDDVAVTADHACGVVEAFAFGNRRGLDVGGFTHVAAEEVEGTTEADAGTGGRFEEEVAEDGTVEHSGTFFTPRVGPHGIGHLEQALYGVSVELAD